MKKIIACTLLSALLFTMSGCANQPAIPGQNNGTEQTAQVQQGPTDDQIAADPFTMKYDDTDAQVKNMAGNDTLGTIGQAGPLYAGKEADSQPGLKKFRELKLALVDEIMKAVGQADTDGRAYAAELKNLKDKYIEYLGRTLEQNNKLGSQMKQIAQQIIEPEVAYTANFALYKSTDYSAIDLDSVKAYFQYQQVYLTLQNVGLLTTDTAQTVSGLMTLESALQASGDANMKTIADDIEKDVPAMTDALGEKLAALQQSASDIDLMLKRIDTAEYYMGQASVQYVQTQMNDLNTQLASLQPREGLAAEDISFMKDMVKYYGDFAGQIKQNLDSVDKKTLLSLAVPAPGLVPVAMAQVVPDTCYTCQAFGMLKSAAQATYSAGKTVGKFTWEAGKTLVSGTRTTIGVTLDTLAATTQSVKDVVGGGLSGDSMAEIGNNIKDNYKAVADNYKEGRSGSDVLKTAHDYFDAADQAGGNLAAGAVEKVIGKGWTSWTAGQVGKLTVNLFTSLGKGITAVANPESTTGETLEGMLDIGMSFIGGSKVIAEGSQMLAGGKGLLKNFGQQGFNLLAKTIWEGDVVAAKALREELKLGAKMTAKELEQALYMNAEDIAFKEKMVQELKGTGAKLMEELKGLIGEGAETVAENATNGLVKNYEEFVKTQFANSLKGLGDAVVAVLGDDLNKYFNNVVGNGLDDIIKAIIKENADKGKIPGLTIIPDLNDLAGHFSGGTMTITDVQVTDEFKQKAKSEGCDYSAIEQQKGKSQTMDVNFQPTSANGGNMTIKMSDGKPQSIPFTYEDGVIKASYSEQGANINLNMNAVVEDGKIKTSGPLEIDYGNGGLKITADTSASKPAPGEPTPPKPAQPAATQAAPAPGAPTTPGGQTPTNPAPVTNDYANT